MSFFANLDIPNLNKKYLTETLTLIYTVYVKLAITVKLIIKLMLPDKVIMRKLPPKPA